MSDFWGQIVLQWGVAKEEVGEVGLGTRLLFPLPLPIKPRKAGHQGEKKKKKLHMVAPNTSAKHLYKFLYGYLFVVQSFKFYT